MKSVDIAFLHRLADAADRETLSRYRQRTKADTKFKEGYRYDPVTEADREAERVMRDLIMKEFPDHAILGEEYGATGDGPVRWVLDPVDGTRPFLCGIPVWGTLIGLTVNGVAELGMMSQPVTGERFFADADGAWCRSKTGTAALKSSVETNITAAILHTNAPEHIRRHPNIAFEKLESAVRFTRYGGECYSFAMLAAGQIDICFEFNLQPYDIVALVPIIERAGGLITTLEGGRVEKGGSVVAAANALLHEKTLELLHS